jgi:type VI secretion system protein ImpF
MWAFRSAAESRDSRQKPEVPSDQEGQRVISGRKGSSVASVSEPILRRQVWRDLEQLMNTIALESSIEDVRRVGHVRSSILNFGLPDIVHRSMDELLTNDRVIERQIETALKTFEPRLLGVTVKRDTTAADAGLKIRFLVSADLSCRPVDIPLEFTAEVEVGSGKFSISRL